LRACSAPPPRRPTHARCEHAEGPVAPWFDAGVEVEDATRRTRLSTERTYLAWWRSGLTALTVALAGGKLVPELSSGCVLALRAARGAGYSLLGIAFIRQHAVEIALRLGAWAPLDARVAAALTATGISLGATKSLWCSSRVLVNPGSSLTRPTNARLPRRETLRKVRTIRSL
jgi:putative membrane protein